MCKWLEYMTLPVVKGSGQVPKTLRPTVKLIFRRVRVLMLLGCLMVLLSLFGFGTRSTVGMTTHSFSTSRAPNAAEVEDRLRGALWGVSYNRLVERLHFYICTVVLVI